MKRFYIAYGSNLNVRQMRMRCPDAVIIGTAFIPDYRLLFKGSKSGNYLTIEPHSGSRVPVAVWLFRHEMNGILTDTRAFRISTTRKVFRWT